MKRSFVIGFALIPVILALVCAALFVVPKRDEVRFLYATAGDAFDSSAYDNFAQSLVVGVRLEKEPLDKLSGRELSRYDAVYLDDALRQAATMRESVSKLTDYVSQGGRLFLENGFADAFPADFLGAERIVDVPATEHLTLEYPEVNADLKGVQTVFRQFAANFDKHVGLSAMPGFSLGKGIVPATGQPLALLNGVSLMTVNRVGNGSVLLASSFLPNRYFVTGFDLQSGIDRSLGFDKLIERANGSRNLTGVAYFDRMQTPLEPFFHFGFATANALLRSEYVGYVAKEKYGYSVKKVLGPNGRPAMAYQNHFEGLSAIRGKDGIQWAELLKKYNQIPSFTLVRGSYDWGQWLEDVAVHLNTGTSAQPHFIGEYANSFYGSGARLAGVDGKPLKQASYPEPKSLGDPITLPYRAAPAFADLNGDGRPDLVAGGFDGTLRVYANEGANPAAYANQPLPGGMQQPDAFGAAQPLTLADGTPLAAGGGYSAVAAADANGDGKPDLFVGGADGSVRLALGRGGFAFERPAAVIAGGKPLRAASYAVPAVGDVTGDGVADLVVGDGDGRVTLYAGRKGEPGAFEAGRAIVQLAAKFAAPSVRDMNGDGVADLAVGTGEGDVRVFEQAGGAWTDKGPIGGDTLNQMGDHALVGGHNAVPVWIDLNHDGTDDLVVGQLEFGLPTAVDDPQFPYAAQLQAFIDYSKKNHIDLLPHLFFHSFKTDEQEKAEIALHRQSFEKLGLPWKDPGTNQHTWRINHPGRVQTLRNESESGIWYNFGFRTPYAPSDPRGFEYLWGMPFQLTGTDLANPMLLYTPVITFGNKEGSATTDIYESFASLDLPIDYFEHIEYHFPGPLVQSQLLPFVEYFDRLRTTADYNFVTEDQMAKSFLTAMHAKVTVSQSWGSYLWSKLKDRIGSGKHLAVTLKPDISGVPHQAGDYRDTLGVVVDPGQKFAGQRLIVDSDVYTRKGDSLYAGLRGEVKLGVKWAEDSFHIVRTNVPTTVKAASGGIRTIELAADGMQQIKLYAPSPIAVEGTDLKIEENADDRTVTVTHFGDRTTITVKPKS